MPANGNIGVRLPKSVHAALLREAKIEGISLNQLCLAKLAVPLAVALGLRKAAEGGYRVTFVKPRSPKKGR